MSQLFVMNRHLRPMNWLLVLLVSACSLPAPYQTYSPGTAPAPTPSRNALNVYGANTTTADNEMDAVDKQTAEYVPPVVASVPAPAGSAATGSQRIAICYSRMWNSAEAVRNAAAQACGSNGAPRIVAQDTDLTACPILTPTHAVYACSP